MSDWSSDVCSSDLFDRVRDVEERRHERERLQSGKLVGAAPVGKRHRRGGGKEGGRDGVDTLTDKQGLTEGRVSGGVEVDAREDVAADHIGREALAILRIIAPQRQRQAVGDVEIDGAEDRESLVRSEENTSEIQSLM